MVFRVPEGADPDVVQGRPGQQRGDQGACRGGLAAGMGGDGQGRCGPRQGVDQIDPLRQPDRRESGEDQQQRAHQEAGGQQAGAHPGQRVTPRIDEQRQAKEGEQAPVPPFPEDQGRRQQGCGQECRQHERPARHLGGPRRTQQEQPAAGDDGDGQGAVNDA